MRRTRDLYPTIILIFLFLGIMTTETPIEASFASDPIYSLIEAFPNLTFADLVDFQVARDGSNRIFAAEHAGIIRVFNNSESTNVSSVFLDIRDRVLVGFDPGLLGFTFDPDFLTNGMFYTRERENPRVFSSGDESPPLMNELCSC